MKKIDLHIHTVATISDSAFTYCLKTLKKYVSEASLDAIAITNHNHFDLSQFEDIARTLDIVVFPGIEVNVDHGHVLIIGSGEQLQDFETKSRLVSGNIPTAKDSISVDTLFQIYGDLHQYLVIPHYNKKPSLSGESLERLRQYVSAGEVDSPKKFIRAIRDSSKLTPVLFSDLRVADNLIHMPTRQTYIDCGDLSLKSIKRCLEDKDKVALSPRDGNRLWQVFDNGQTLSTGLNVLLGERSSGKTYTLNKLCNTVHNVKYIKQFELVQQDEEKYEKEFTTGVQKQRSTFVDGYLMGLRTVLDDIIAVDLVANERRIDRYIDSLLAAAEAADSQDTFSRTALFDETEFPISQTRTLHELIESVRQIIENIEYRDIIEKHVDLVSLKRLACELILLLWRKAFEDKKKLLVNEIVTDIKQHLQLRTSAEPIEDVDLYKARMDTKRVERFTTLVTFLKKEKVIHQENVQGFRIEAKKGPYEGAGEIKAASGVKVAFSEAFKAYDTPYEYLRLLLENESLDRSIIYKLFVKVNYRILNKDGYEVSGGERSEFRLLQEIKDAQKYDMLLIDEPESSFDNLFLKGEVNHILKDLSRSMPVVVVTHNSTVGASIGADYLIYAKKELESGKVVYRLYFGYPTNKQLVSVDGRTMRNHELIMDSLEAGIDTYDARRKGYEAIKD